MPTRDCLHHLVDDLRETVSLGERKLSTTRVGLTPRARFMVSQDVASSAPTAA
jgi:hypothetical protein